MNQRIDSKKAIVILVILTIFIAGWAIFESFFVSFPILFPISFPPPIKPEIKEIEKFSSEEDFKAYLAEAELAGVMGGFAMMGAARARAMPEVMMEAPLAMEKVPERVSETTVQVVGIDEPDIVKTDGKEIYFSPGKSYYWRRFIENIPPQISGETKIIRAFPPEDLEIKAKIDKRGDLLLHQNILVIFSGNKIYGYDISNPENPERKWSMDLEEKSYMVAARLFEGKIYLITKTRIDRFHPCPIRPLTIEGVPLAIECTEIYHPVVSVPVDVTYSAIVFDPNSGEIEKNISFVGTSDLSILYMSKNAIYVTYSYSEDFVKFYYNFLNEECKDIIPDWVLEKLEKLIEYDISSAAKLVEFQVIFGSYFNSLDSDERLRIENELTNRMADFYQEHKRELGKTGIVKIGLDKFEVQAVGNVPGSPLNQFSLDEYNGFLRIATTIGGGFLGVFDGRDELANDVYVLDNNLEIVGSIKNLGLEERIYSVRFLEDKGYIVTFRQIDPFFVLDLSDPQKPELKGELKIPGYSSYLHPITKDKILGVGKEGAKVKISLFDVENPENPTELDKYTLDEYWSDILDTHHAFLLDKKHEIFFLPGSKGGYVFSYEENKLELIRAISDIRARRAIYINDFLYIIGDDKIVVLNEINWERVSEIVF